MKFFKKEEERRIIAAIGEAEKQTSGEIRVHLEKDLEGNAEDAAVKTFARLRMDRTADSNGVLIFIVPSKKQFAIIGDKGIHAKVPPNFWQEVRDVMQRHFRDGDYTEGVCQGVLLAGQKLKEHFPWQSDDVNELPDDISYG